jgi:hypothetical protein
MMRETSAVRTERPERQPIPLPTSPDHPACPTCGGRMWDNRASKRNPKAPDFKCRDRTCDGVLWPGQHRALFQAVEPPRIAAVQDVEKPKDKPATETSSGDESLRSRYLNLTDFVIDSVRPKYEERGLQCGPDTVAAITATLYIAETRRVGS